MIYKINPHQREQSIVSARANFPEPTTSLTLNGSNERVKLTHARLPESREINQRRTQRIRQQRLQQRQRGESNFDQERTNPKVKEGGDKTGFAAAVFGTGTDQALNRRGGRKLIY